MLVNSGNLLQDASSKKYAIGAFNFTNFESLKAIINAAEKLKTPVILAASPSAINYMGLDNIVASVKALIEKSETEFCLHLDHGLDFDICKNCIDAGFTSVMIDASDKSFEQNVSITQKVVEYARSKNVTVEAELGKLCGIEDEKNEDIQKFTDPSEARLFAHLTNIDSLAISIGTSHGAYKFKGKPTLKLDLLQKIKSACENTPLVLHGASSIPTKLLKEFHEFGGSMNGAKGVDEKLLKIAINLGICKVNVDSDLRLACTTAIRKVLQNKKVFSPRDYLKPAIDKMQEVVEYKIIKVLNS